MKNILRFFIKFPVSINVLIVAIFLFGIMGIISMKSSFFPLSPTNTITIQIAYPGSSPNEIEEGVVLKIEDNLRGLIGLDRVTSVSSENSALITIETINGYDIDAVLADVKNAVDRVPNYPADMEPPVVAKRESIQEAISFTVSGKDLDLKTLKYAARQIEDDLRSMEGISQITLSGFPDEEIEVAVREKDMRAFNLSFPEIARAVSTTNLLTTGGSIKTETEEYLIRARNKYYNAVDLENIVVRADQQGNIIHLKDVANVSDKFSETPDRLFMNGNSAVQIQVNSTNNEDLILAANKTVAYIDHYNNSSNNIKLDITRDASIRLKERTQLLMENGGFGIILVIIFLSIFLRPSIAFWVAFGLPISFLGMFIFANYFGVTINILSLFGMIIVVGILVDDAIVIGENIYHHYEKGKSPIEACLDGTMEVLPAIFSAILTTVLAFSTFFFIDGRVGDNFGEVSTVVVLILVISLVEAIIILPSHLAHSNALKQGGRRYLINRIGDKIIYFLRDKLYLPALSFLLEHRFFGFAVPFALLMITIGGIRGGVLKTTFFPSIASDRISIDLKMPQGTNELKTLEILDRLEVGTHKVNEGYKELQSGNKSVVQTIIKRLGPGSSSGQIQIELLPGEERDFSAFEIANAIRDSVGPVYGVEYLTFGSNSNFGGKPISIALVGNNIAELKAAKLKLKDELGKMPELKDVQDTDPAGIKEVKIKLKESAYALGFTLESVISQVRGGFFGQQAQRFQRGRDEIRVYVRYDKAGRNSILDLDEMRLLSPSGERVLFSEVAEYSIERGEVAINHLEGQREIRIEADLSDRKQSATDILNDIKGGILPKIKAKYPSVGFSYEGQSREAEKMVSSVRKVALIILFLIYATIAFVFRSYSQPILLLILVPFSLIGVGWGHYIHGFSINMLSWLGIIALIGIMVNDGLVLISKFNTYIKDGMKFKEALFESGRSRFRAVFLTSLTTVAGLAPLMFETSRQAQYLIPMAISIAYGIVVATLLTLLILPLLLYLSNSIKLYLNWLYTGKKPERIEMERAYKELKSLENENL
jgi:multidrug efflux pump subunit AcrB